MVEALDGEQIGFWVVSDEVFVTHELEGSVSWLLRRCGGGRVGGEFIHHGFFFSFLKMKVGVVSSSSVRAGGKS